MSRSVLQHRQWHLLPDQEPDAEPVTYCMECAVCQASSEEALDIDGPQRWVLQHSGRNPSHHTYRELVAHPWRTWMS